MNKPINREINYAHRYINPINLKKSVFSQIIYTSNAISIKFQITLWLKIEKPVPNFM